MGGCLAMCLFNTKILVLAGILRGRTLRIERKSLPFLCGCYYRKEKNWNFFNTIFTYGAFWPLSGY